jgi:argininosuccinate synthase
LCKPLPSHGLPVSRSLFSGKRGHSTHLPLSDENLFHISYEAGILEDPNTTPPADMWKLTTSPEHAPNEPEQIQIVFEKGLPVKVTTASGTHTDAVDVFLVLNALARKHGVGRVDIVENRFIGVKSRGCYESPAATILRVAHMDLEGMTLDRNVRALRDQFLTIELSRILYNGYWFSPEREFLTSAIPASQATVNGTVKLKLYKGNVVVEGRTSDEVRPATLHSLLFADLYHPSQGLYDEKFSSMDEMGGFEPEETSGFISVSAIRLKAWANAKYVPQPFLDLDKRSHSCLLASERAREASSPPTSTVPVYRGCFRERHRPKETRVVVAPLSRPPVLFLHFLVCGTRAFVSG